jgi:hypothetical protein
MIAVEELGTDQTGAGICFARSAAGLDRDVPVLSVVCSSGSGPEVPILRMALCRGLGGLGEERRGGVLLGLRGVAVDDDDRAGEEWITRWPTLPRRSPAKPP